MKDAETRRESWTLGLEWRFSRWFGVSFTPHDSFDHEGTYHEEESISGEFCGFRSFIVLALIEDRRNGDSCILNLIIAQ